VKLIRDSLNTLVIAASVFSLAACSGASTTEESTAEEEAERAIDPQAELAVISSIPTQPVEMSPTPDERRELLANAVALPLSPAEIISVYPVSRIWVVDFYQRVEADSLANVIVECTNDFLCSELLDAVATYFGIPPEVLLGITSTADILSSAENLFVYDSANLIRYTGGDQGPEDFYFRMETPAGYKACKAHPLNVSQIGQGHFSMQVSADEARAYMYLKRLDLGDRDSRAQGQAIIEIVREDRYFNLIETGYCSISEEPSLIWDSSF